MNKILSVFLICFLIDLINNLENEKVAYVSLSGKNENKAYYYLLMWKLVCYIIE